MADNTLRAALLEFSVRCKAVVACRVSPDQKRALVHLVKKGRHTVLIHSSLQSINFCFTCTSTIHEINLLSIVSHLLAVLSSITFMKIYDPASLFAFIFIIHICLPIYIHFSLSISLSLARSLPILVCVSLSHSHCISVFLQLPIYLFVFSSFFLWFSNLLSLHLSPNIFVPLLFSRRTGCTYTVYRRWSEWRGNDTGGPCGRRDKRGRGSAGCQCLGLCYRSVPISQSSAPETWKIQLH